MTSRTIAIGDIHGCHIALDTLLEEIQPGQTDTVVVLGDVIDRGPGTRQCIDRLLALRRVCRVVHLMGNHEEMFLDTIVGGEWSRTWYQYGGLEMMQSYGNGGFSAIPPAHMDFIRGGKDYFETDREIFVHGYLRPTVPLDHELAYRLRWSRFEPTSARHSSGKRVICGHTAQPGSRPLGGATYLCIDTCVYAPEGALSALDVGTDTLWQATQAGELRPARPLSDVLSAG